jgi:hypothetical protein
MKTLREILQEKEDFKGSEDKFSKLLEKIEIKNPEPVFSYFKYFYVLPALAGASLVFLFALSPKNTVIQIPEAPLSQNEIQVASFSADASLAGSSFAATSATENLDMNTTSIEVNAKQVLAPQTMSLSAKSTSLETGLDYKQNLLNDLENIGSFNETTYEEI